LNYIAKHKKPIKNKIVEKCVGEIAHGSLWEDSKYHVNVGVDMFVQSIYVTVTDIYLENKKELNVQENKGLQSPYLTKGRSLTFLQ
jgi:S-adenosylmethionine synthetase